MATQIHDIAIGAMGFLLDPVLLFALIVAVLAIITGFAGRIALIVEDLRYHQIHGRHGRPANPPAEAQERSSASAAADRPGDVTRVGPRWPVAAHLQRRSDAAPTRHDGGDRDLEWERYRQRNRRHGGGHVWFTRQHLARMVRLVDEKVRVHPGRWRSGTATMSPRPLRRRVVSLPPDAPAVSDIEGSSLPAPTPADRAGRILWAT